MEIQLDANLNCRLCGGATGTARGWARARESDRDIYAYQAQPKSMQQTMNIEQCG